MLETGDIDEIDFIIANIHAEGFAFFVGCLFYELGYSVGLSRCVYVLENYVLEIIKYIVRDVQGGERNPKNKGYLFPIHGRIIHAIGGNGEVVENNSTIVFFEEIQIV